MAREAILSDASREKEEDRLLRPQRIAEVIGQQDVL